MSRHTAHLIGKLRELYSTDEGWARVRCDGCAEGRPTDREVVEAAITDATPEDLAAWTAQIQGRRVA